MKKTIEQTYVTPEMLMVNFEMEQYVLTVSVQNENVGNRNDDIDW
jgi:hypothetical protein